MDLSHHQTINKSLQLLGKISLSFFFKKLLPRQQSLVVLLTDMDMSELPRFHMDRLLN